MCERTLVPAPCAVVLACPACGCDEDFADGGGGVVGGVGGESEERGEEGGQG